MVAINQLVSEVLVKDSASASYDRITASMDRTAAAESRVQAGAAGVETKMASSSAAVDRAARAWGGLQSRVDQNFASHQKIAAAAAQAERAVALGVATQSRAAEVVALATARYGEHVGVLDRLRGGYERLNGVLGLVGISIAVGAIIRFGVESIKTAAEIGELASRAGFTTAQFQGLQYAAAKAGLSIDEMDTAVARLTRSIGDAAEGNKKALDTFNSLHVGVLNANNTIRSSADIFTDVARAIGEIQEPARRAVAEVALFGRAGQAMDELIVKFAEGKASVGQLADAARMAGFAFDDPLIKRAKELEGQFELTKREAEVFALEGIEGVLIPALAALFRPVTTTIHLFQDLSAAIGEAAKQSRYIAAGGQGRLVVDIPIAPYTPPAATGGAHNPPSTEAMNKAAAAAKKLATEYDALLAKISPLTAAQQEYDKGLEIIDAATKAGLSSELQRGALLTELNNKYRDALNPLAAVKRALDDELSALKLNDSERAIHNTLLQKENELRRAGIDLTPRQKADLEAEVRAIEAQKQLNMVNKDIAGQQDEMRVAQAQLGLVGATDAQRATSIAQITAENELRRQGIAIGSTEGQQYVRNAQAIAGMNVELQQQQTRLADLKTAGETVFSSLTASLANFAKTGKLDLSSFVTTAVDELGKLAEMDLKDWVFGGPGGRISTLFDKVGGLFGLGGSPAAANQNVPGASPVAGIGGQIAGLGATILGGGGGDTCGCIANGALGTVGAINQAAGLDKATQLLVGKDSTTALVNATTSQTSTLGSVFASVTGALGRGLSAVWQGLSSGASAAGGLFGSLLEGGGKLLGSLATSAIGFLFHGGGIVGQTSVPGRLLPAAAFAGAPRYHSGLLPGEMPAILQQGESVLTAGQTSALATSGGPIVAAVNAGAASTVAAVGSASTQQVAATQQQTSKLQIIFDGVVSILNTIPSIIGALTGGGGGGGMGSSLMSPLLNNAFGPQIGGLGTGLMRMLEGGSGSGGMGVLMGGVGDVGGLLSTIMNQVLGAVLHDGGIVGMPGGAMRLMPAAAFAGAPRYHSGGMPGFANDEVPAILQRGERVLSRAQVQRGDGGGGPTIHIGGIHFHQPTDVDGMKRAMPQVGRDLGLALQRAMARNA